MKQTLCAVAVMLIVGISTVYAQDACEVVESAIALAAENCGEIGRSEVCYGNDSIEADASADAGDFTFEQSGDLALLSDIAALRLGSQVVPDGKWGITMMNVPVVTEDGTADLQFVLFGEVAVSNDGVVAAGDFVEPVTVELTSTGNLNVRGSSSTSAAVVGSLSTGDVIVATGRNATADWVQFALDDGTIGWVYAPLMNTDGDLTTLSVVEGTANEASEPTEFSDIQAFTVTTGMDDAPCEAAPDSGLLIQTPVGVGQVEVVLNEVVISLGSTAYIRANPNDEMIVSLVEGQATITADQTDRFTPAGTQTRIPLTNGIASGPPSVLEPFDMVLDGLLPVPLLERDDIDVAVSLTQAEIDSLGPSMIWRIGSPTMTFQRGSNLCDVGTESFEVPKDDNWEYAEFLVSAGTTITVEVFGGGAVGDLIYDYDSVPTAHFIHLIGYDQDTDLISARDARAYLLEVGSGAEKSLTVTIEQDMAVFVHVGAQNSGGSKPVGGGGTYLWEGFPFTISCS